MSPSQLLQDTKVLFSLDMHIRGQAITSYEEKPLLAIAATHLTGSIWDGSVLVCPSLDSSSPSNSLISHHTKHGCSDVCWIKDNKVLGSAADDGSVQIWEFSEGNLILQDSFQEHDKSVSVVASRHGLMASGSADATVRVWDVEQTTSKQTLEGHWGGVTDCSWAAEDVNQLVTVSKDKQGRVWDLRSNEASSILSSKAPIHACSYLSSTHVLIGTEAGELVLFDLKNPAKPISSCRQGSNSIAKLCNIPSQASTAAIANDDGTLSIKTFNSGKTEEKSASVKFSFAIRGLVVHEDVLYVGGLGKSVHAVHLKQ